MSKIEIIARLVAVQQGSVLLSHKIGAPYTFLPGGHVEYGESAIAALHRELREECGCAVEVLDFLGVVEHAYSGEKKRHQELNLLFSGRLPGARFPQPPASLEAHIEFLWQPLGRLEQANLLPVAMIALVRRCAAAQLPPGLWESNL